MWFTESGVNKIGRIDAGSATSAFVPPPSVPPLQITTHQDVAPAKKACRVPRVRGLRIGQARKKLRRAKCTVPHPRQGPRVLGPPARRGAHPRDRAAEGEAALA